MEWGIKNKNKLVQVGYKFPSDTSTCEVSVNASLAGHKNYIYPLDKIKGNTGEIGIWLFEITKNRGLVKNLKGGLLFCWKYSLSSYWKHQAETFWKSEGHIFV